MPLFFWYDLFLEARAEIQIYFRSYFGANELFKKSFRNYQTFRNLQSCGTQLASIPAAFQIIGEMIIDFCHHS